jgi:excinuclease ABC subunit A
LKKLVKPTAQLIISPTDKLSVTEATDLVLQKFQGQRGYVLIKIAAANRIADGKQLHALLLQDGYLRIIIPEDRNSKSKTLAKSKSRKSTLTAAATAPSAPIQVMEISGPEAIKKGLPKEDFYLVIDRIAFDKADRDRLADSIHQAYEASLKYTVGVAVRGAEVWTTNKETLLLREDSSCSICGYQSLPVSSKFLSFNSPVGACPTCKGFGNILELDVKKVIPNPNLSIDEGALNPYTMPSAESDRKELMAFCKKNKIDVKTPWSELPKEHQDLIWNGEKKGFWGVKGLFHYLDQIKYKMHIRVFVSRFRSPTQCPDCKGSRLRKEASDVYIHAKNIHDYCQMTIEDLNQYFETLNFSKNELEIAKEIIKQIKSRLNFLVRVGVNYLTLNRETRTLSGGEYQRLMLANQLGMGLSQTLYVLDEPTVGLHPRDNDRLISILQDLKNLGNTLVVVEHDHDVIKNSDYVMEMGPGSGYLGGKIVFEGSKLDFLKSETSLTAKYLRPAAVVASNALSVVPETTKYIKDIQNYKYKITLTGASGNNLQNVDVDFPLNRLVVVTGVSGSGKSTLVTKTLYPELARRLEIDFLPTQPFKDMQGHEHVKNVIMIDQSSIGRSARSSPVTYLKIFDAIRTIMANIPESKARKYTPGTFSLNVDGGRCPTCKGAGIEEIDMMFMDNVIIPCDVCDGAKYQKEILEVTYKGKTIADILKLTVTEAMQFFVDHPNIWRPLSVLKDVGLDYLQLGQPAVTLSGGESQRMKIAKELSQTQTKGTLYILDEPTTGLHFKEIELLLKVMRRLIENGSSVLVVEHNQDVIAGADYVIDLGPDAGIKGGQLVACGSPLEIMQNKNSLTGKYLKAYLERK